MAYIRSYALNKIRKQKNSSFRKIKAGALGNDGKPVPKEKQAWHAGRIAGLKTATGAFYSGKKQGYSQGRKAGFKSGRIYGAITRRSYNYRAY